MAQYRLAAEQAPANADIWYNLANALAATGPPDETEQCYRTAIALKPGFADALANYGRWLMTRGRWAEAEDRIWPNRCTMAPMQAGTWNNLGIVSHGTRPGGGRAMLPQRHRDRTRAWPMRTTISAACCRSTGGRTRRSPATGLRWLPNRGCRQARLAVCMAQLADRATGRKREVRRERGSAMQRNWRPWPMPVRWRPRSGRRSRSSCRIRGRTIGRCRRSTGRSHAVCWRAPAPPVTLAGPPAPGERIRLGIVSGFFCDHTI